METHRDGMCPLNGLQTSLPSPEEAYRQAVSWIILKAADLLQLCLQHQQAARAIQLHLQAEHDLTVSWASTVLAADA